MVKTLPVVQAFKELQLPGTDRNLFSSPDWINVILKTYGTNIFAKYVEENGEIQSYIIYSVVKNFLEWKICICSYCDYFDCCVASREHWQLLFDDIRREYPRYRIAVRNLRDGYVRQIPDLKVLSKERFHIIDLAGTVDDVWKRTHDSFRAAVRQAEKLGLTARHCPKEDLKKFYDLHLQVRKYKYKIFPQPYRFFDIIWQQYMDKGKGTLLGAFDKNGKFISGNVYLECGETLYYKFNTSSKDALKLRPNNFLFWEGIKYAKKKGMKFMDLGSSGCEQEGLILFKNHTGAQMQDITHLGFAPPGYKFSQKRILTLMTKTFTLPWMPDFMLKVGSSIIYPFLA